MTIGNRVLNGIERIGNKLLLWYQSCYRFSIYSREVLCQETF